MKSKSKKIAWLLVIGLACFSQLAHAYSNKKVILLAARTAQSDSLGYNFVNELANTAYGWINDGKAVLWDSPEKKSMLSMADLKGIEKNSSTSFGKLANVFVYESWTMEGKKFSFVLKGFSFTGSDAKGEDVLFGFIDCNSDVKELLKNAPLHVNANGTYGATLYTALMNMNFAFNLVYFDNGPLTDYKNSSKIVDKAIHSGKKITNTVRLPQTKWVSYGWDSTDLAQLKISDQLTAILSDFLNNNKQEFYNYGGDKYYSYLKNKPVLISGFHVNQEWTREKNGRITYTTVSILPYTVGIPLQPIPAQKLDEWKLAVKDTPMTEYLNTKDFGYAIKKVNETVIPPAISERVKNALFAGNWDHIL